MPEAASPHFLVLKLQGFQAILLEVEQEVLLSEIGPRRSLDKLLESLSPQQHLVAVMSRYLRHMLLPAEDIYVREALSVDTNYALVASLCRCNRFLQTALQLLRPQVEIGWQESHMKVGIPRPHFKAIEGGPEDSTCNDPCDCCRHTGRYHT